MSTVTRRSITTGILCRMEHGSRFEILDHTADVRVRIVGADPADLLVSAARALAFLLSGETESEEESRIEWEGQAQDLEVLLVDVLNELIFLHETKGLVLPRLKVHELNLPRYRIVASGGKPTGSKGGAGVGLKAATYSGLEVVEAGDGTLTAEVIFDV